VSDERAICSVMLRTEVQAVVNLGRMPADDEPFDEVRVRAWVDALDAVQPRRLSDEEAIALLDCFPLDDSIVYEVAWSLLHAIESTFPYTPDLLSQLDDRSWWTRHLRERAARSGRPSDSG
jgi:hypothetical protein